VILSTRCLQSHRPGESQPVGVCQRRQGLRQPSRSPLASSGGSFRDGIDKRLLFGFESARRDEPGLTPRFSRESSGADIRNPNLNRPQPATTQALAVRTNLVAGGGLRCGRLRHRLHVTYHAPDQPVQGSRSRTAGWRRECRWTDGPQKALSLPRIDDDRCRIAATDRQLSAPASQWPVPAFECQAPGFKRRAPRFEWRAPALEFR